MDLTTLRNLILTVIASSSTRLDVGDSLTEIADLLESVSPGGIGLLEGMLDPIPSNNDVAQFNTTSGLWEAKSINDAGIVDKLSNQSIFGGKRFIGLNNGDGIVVCVTIGAVGDGPAIYFQRNTTSSIGYIKGERESGVGGKLRFFTRDIGGASDLCVLEVDSVQAVRIPYGGMLWGSVVGTQNWKYIDYAASATNPAVMFSSRSVTSNAVHHVFLNPNGVVGSISTSASNTLYNTSSDRRLKKNIAPAASAVSKLKKLKIQQFDWNVDNSHEDFGIISDELQTDFPQFVTGKVNATKKIGKIITTTQVAGELSSSVHVQENVEKPIGPLAENQTWEFVKEVIDPQLIDPSKLVPLLVKALQEAFARIEVLEAAINE